MDLTEPASPEFDVDGWRARLGRNRIMPAGAWRDLGLPRATIDALGWGLPGSLVVTTDDFDFQVFFSPLRSAPVALTNPRLWRGAVPSAVPDGWGDEFVVGDVDTFGGPEMVWTVNRVSGQITDPGLEGDMPPMLVNSSAARLLACVDASLKWSSRSPGIPSELLSVIAGIDPGAADSEAFWGGFLGDEGVGIEFRIGSPGSMPGSIW